MNWVYLRIWQKSVRRACVRSGVVCRESLLADAILFYKNIVPLDRDAHRDLTLDTQAARFGFTRASNVIPAVVDEFTAAAHHLPIVFLPGGGTVVPVFLVGLRTGQNALVDRDGQWTGGYVPAFARRYPFIFGEMEGRDSVACIDDACEGLRHAGGERLFKEDGTETALLIERVTLMNEYFAAAKRNDVFAKLLVDLQLLLPVSIDAKFESGDTAALHGFLTIDTAKLEALSDADFLRLRQGGFIPAVYAHVASLANIDRICKSMDALAASAGKSGKAAAKAV